MELRESKRYRGYFSDKEGNIYSNRRGKMVLKKLRKDKDGYLITNVIDDVKGFETTLRAHRLVAECWVPNPENKPVVNHKNNIKDDNNYNNLEWSTIAENTQHAYDGGWVKSAASKTVSLYIDNELTCVYPTVIKCSEMLSVDRNRINKIIKDNKKLYDFMEFKIEGKEESENLLSIIKSFDNLNPILNKDTGETYQNIREMSNSTGITFSSCQYYIKRGYNNKNEKIEKISKQQFLIDSNYIK